MTAKVVIWSVSQKFVDNVELKGHATIYVSQYNVIVDEKKLCFIKNMLDV